MKELRDGMRDGIPIGLGYFAVAFSLGIAARNGGLNAFQGFLTSLFCVASAGEYAAFMVITAGGSYAEMAMMTLVANARYFLMSAAFSQRMREDMPLYHRIFIGYGMTDEIFGVSIARPGYVKPAYSYGAMLTSIPFWCVATALGVVAGNILPASIVRGLSVTLYGMFIAIIVPPAKKDKVVFLFVVLSFIMSYLSEIAPLISGLSSGTRTIILTVILSAAAAYFFPHVEEAAVEEEA